ncbi:MAG TPA: hypothetical protein VGR78_14420 [Verrucomicrobiae bacterium]|jgi:hypothetical protein|nr:hypothetical protein [Verrucomicrobiae bacterium]
MFTGIGKCFDDPETGDAALLGLEIRLGAAYYKRVAPLALRGELKTIQMRTTVPHPGRLTAFGLWVTRRAAGRSGKTKAEFQAILSDARALLGPASVRKSYFEAVDRDAAKLLHTRARAAQNEFKKQPWGPVRVIHCCPLLLVEQGWPFICGTPILRPKAINWRRTGLRITTHATGMA